MCEKVVYTCPFILDFIPNCYKTQEMCKKAVSKEPFMLKYCLDKYKSHKVCKEAAAYLPLLKFVATWFVTNKILKGLDNAVFFNDDIVFVNADSDNVTTFSNYVGLVKVDLINVSLDDYNFDNGDPEIIIHIRTMAW